MCRRVHFDIFIQSSQCSDNKRNSVETTKNRQTETETCQNSVNTIVNIMIGPLLNATQTNESSIIGLRIFNNNIIGDLMPIFNHQVFTRNTLIAKPFGDKD